MKGSKGFLVGMTVVLLSFAFIMVSCDGGAPQVNPFVGTYDGEVTVANSEYDPDDPLSGPEEIDIPLTLTVTETGFTFSYTVPGGGNPTNVIGPYSFNTAIYIGGAASTTFTGLGTANINAAGDELRLAINRTFEGETYSGTVVFERQ